MKKIGIITILLVLIDFFVKFFIKTNLELLKSIVVISNFFNITYVRNIGAAFSILEGSRIFLILVASITLILVYFFLIRNKNLTRFDIISYSMLLAGIIGNLIDRIIYGYVIDYLDFKILNYNFPVFNLADTFIVISVILILIKEIKGKKGIYGY